MPFNCVIFGLIVIMSLSVFGVWLFKIYIYFTSSQKKRNVQKLVQLIRQKYETNLQNNSLHLDEPLDSSLRQVLHPIYWKYLKNELIQLREKEWSVQTV